MWTEIRHLLWLQGRLMRSSLRSGNRQDVLRTISVGLLMLLLIPGIIGFNALLVWIYRVLDPVASAEVAALVLSFLILSWLISPASNQQLVEPFDLPRLFQHPISLAGLIAGSLAVNTLSLGFLSTLPFALALIAGFPRSFFAILPISLSSLLFLAGMIIFKSLMDDVLDLIAEDRRLRMLAVLLALVPVLFIFGGQLYFQASFMPGGAEPNLNIRTLADLNRFIIDVRPSQYLIWQPGGWIARAVGAAATGDYRAWLGWSGVLLAFVGAGLLLHQAMLRRLYFGELLRFRVSGQTGGDKVGADGWRLPIVSARTSHAFWGLLRADWRSFNRNPFTVRMAIVPVMLGLMSIFFGRTMPGPPVLSSVTVAGFTVMVLTLAYGHNVFGVMDNPGLTTVLLAPVRPRLLLLSHNILLTATVLVLAAIAGLLVAGLNRDWLALPAALGATLGLQLPMLATCNLTSVFLPYKVDLERGRAAANETRTSMIAVFAVMGGAFLLAAPAALSVILPILFLPAFLPPGILIAAVYSIAVYVGVFYLAGRAMEARGDRIVAAISEGP